jgi:hypothetical protein
MSNTGTSKRQRSGTKLSFAILKALFFTLLFTVVLVFLASLAIVRHPDPLPLIPYVGMGILAVAALLCGYFTAKFTKGSFPIGMFGGVILAALLFAAAAVFGASAAVFFGVLIVCCSMFSPPYSTSAITRFSNFL